MPPRNRRPQTASTATDSGATAATTVAPPQAPEGWEVGNAAPSDKYAPMNADGSADLGKITTDPPKGMGVQLVARGDTVTQAVYDQLNPKQADQAPGVATATPVPEPQGPAQTEPPKQ